MQSVYVFFSGLSHVLHSMSELMQVQEPDDSNEEFITLSEGSFSLQSYNRKQVLYFSLVKITPFFLPIILIFFSFTTFPIDINDFSSIYYGFRKSCIFYKQTQEPIVMNLKVRYFCFFIPIYILIFNFFY